MGSLMPVMEAARVLRFLARCKPDPESECILWTGSTNGDGYGTVKWPGFTRCGVALVHRVAVWLFLGILLADDEEVDHLCEGHHNCVNVYHFEIVTRQVNASRGARRHWGTRRRASVGTTVLLPPASTEAVVW